MQEKTKTVLILMTCGPSTPSRCATPFFIASLLASMDADVTVFLTMEAVKLAQQGVAEQLVAIAGGAPILHFMREAKSTGAKIHLCRPALPGYDIHEEGEIIAEVDEVSSGGCLADLLLSSDKVITF